MNCRFSWKTLLVRAGLVIALTATGIAHAQLVVGGDTPSPNDTTASSTPSQNLELQVWVGLRELSDYDPGPFGGSDKLSEAIATFQYRNDLPVTGEVSEELAGAIQTQVRAQGGGSAAAGATESASGSLAGEADPCLQQEARETAGTAARVQSATRIGARLLRRVGIKNDVTEATQEASNIASDVRATASDVGALSPNCQQ